MLSRVTLSRSDIVVPVFVCEGIGVKKPVASMPGVFQMSVDVAADWLDGLAADGFASYIAFGVVPRERKDATGSEALRAGNVVCRLLEETKKRGTNMLAMTDLCLCEYPDHGHCGPIDAGRETVANDVTLELLARQAKEPAPRERFRGAFSCTAL